jgi:hypothetical protein
VNLSLLKIFYPIGVAGKRKTVGKYGPLFLAENSK